MSFMALSLVFFSTFGHAAAEPKLAAYKIETIDRTNFRINIENAVLDINIKDRVLLSKKDDLLEWVGYSAQAVTNYYGHFPVDQVQIRIQVTDQDKVRFGQAFGGDEPFLRVVVGEKVSAKTLQQDWIMVHEMVHLAMANVPRNQRWLLEGLATYVESIARAQVGHLSEDFVWNGFVSRMHQGLAKVGDKGLDNTPTWGRTYWGGALFCFLADIEIRKLSNNQKSLQDALRGILSDGFSMKADTTAIKIFKSGDRATGFPVMVNLYEKLKDQPLPDSLDSLWHALGLSLDNKGNVIYNDKAELAAIRQQILKP